ncbi:MAG: hypothetical protein O2992_10750 [Gemmatimonadetes bacterium]|nr:hypothetical protein [Gemmatimonadota bacterium]
MTSLYDSGRTSRLLSIGVLSLAILLAGGGVWGYLSIRDSRPVLDPESLCPMDGPRSRTVMLLDVSDALSEKQRAAMDRLLSDLRDPETSGARMMEAGLPGGARYVEPYSELVAYSLREETAAQKPFLRVCNPGNPDDMTIGGELTASKRRLAARWESFGRQVQDAFDAKSEADSLPNSPVLETISLIIQREAPSLAVRASGGGIPVRLIIFSDMLQHSQTLSQFRELPTWDDLSQGTRYADLRSDLSEISIVIYYLQRPQYARVQTPQHFHWWREAIAKMNGRLVYMEPL